MPGANDELSYPENNLMCIVSVRLECLYQLENGLQLATNACVPQVLRMADTTICRREARE